ncbi:signal recognition particle-docking protein FtsY [Anaeromyxobacter dehalogenans 2CP-1]|uniref:Signal recognition particle receptor FtsY n=1 Tax=Anaeromyxobacter dehalogenans (strain ATCC BAA-258 / DSM 21875 / 2CP-1) TaxID=455488 RepID=B8JD35_ANAD2|nr:signal recognition particle-docking protein FtsY [Anaeromyxobacter dehalogenans]ACL64063.1 signal recognition particle-docking protein FtsY [Anaeromyxobacter dehalogenans 2CP-1]
MIPLALTANDAAAVAIVVAVLLLVVLAALRLARKRRAAPGAPPRAAPPAAPPAERLARGATEEEAAAALRRAGREAPRPVAPPPPPPAAGPAAPPEDREALEARRKEEYRRKKEAERLEKERRAEERAEEARRAREEAERQAREAEEARRRAEEEARRRAEAEAGKTLAAGLEKTRGGFMARLNALFAGGKVVDDSVLADLEEVLFTADIGVKTATRLLESAREKVRRKELSDPERLKAALREEIARILDLAGTGGAAAPLAVGEARPWVVMVVGVNGSGKTTTVGKLAAKLQGAGHKVLLGAGDTFRAAAGEQLEVWAERVSAPVVRGKEGADPAAVCFEAVQRGAQEGVDVVLCDTAGRLHTKMPLMEELKKVQRVIGKAAAGAPHEVLLVLDATNGQNAIAQARQFHEALGVTGIALTKLDGTAKGGVIIGICDELRIPVRYVGVGERVADLKPFSPREFVEALFE